MWTRLEGNYKCSLIIIVVIVVIIVIIVVIVVVIVVIIIVILVSEGNLIRQSGGIVDFDGNTHAL